MPTKSLRISYIFIIIAVLISCSSCDSIKRVTEFDYSGLDGLYITAIRQGWQKPGNGARYRIGLPDSTVLDVFFKNSEDELLIDSLTISSGAIDTTLVGGYESFIDSYKLENIITGVTQMEQCKMHFLCCMSQNSVQCRVWVLGFWWIDLCKYEKDHQVKRRATEFKLSDGWFLNISPPTDWERYYLRGAY